MALKLTAEITGQSRSDLNVALEEVLRLIQEEFTSGFNSNETGSFRFDITGEEGPEEDEQPTPQVLIRDLPRSLAARCIDNHELLELYTPALSDQSYWYTVELLPDQHMAPGASFVACRLTPADPEEAPS